MKKIDPTVIRETLYVALITLILSVLLQAVILIIGKWNYTHLLGNLWGYLAAVLNFFLIGITVQKALEKDEKDAKNMVKLSQSGRTLMLLMFAVVGYAVPFFHLISVVIPMLFPSVAVFMRPLFQKEKTIPKQRGDII